MGATWIVGCSIRRLRSFGSPPSVSFYIGIDVSNGSFSKNQRWYMVRSLSPSPVEKKSSAVNVIIQLPNFFRVSESHMVCSVVNMWAVTSRRKQCSSGTTVKLTQFSSSSGTYPPIAVVRAAALANVDRHPVIFFFLKRGQKLCPIPLIKKKFTKT
jgi:hypothetical protein